MRYQHIVWDWNGTLLNDVVVCVEVVNELLRARHLEPLTLGRYYELFDFPVIEFYRKLGFDFQRESYPEMAREYIEQYTARLSQCRLQHHARQVLQKLQETGITQSVLSAYHQKKLQEAVTSFQLEPFFVRLIGLHNYSAAGKRENGKKWIAKLDTPKDKVLLVGDTAHDWEVAREMGVDL